MPLLPCSVCQRHVRIDDTVCPFCGTELGRRVAPQTPSLAATARMSRAARIALGTALAAMALPGCGSGASDPKNPAPTASPDPAPPTEPGPPDDGAPVAEYGAPAPPQPEPDPGGDAPEYGAPAPDR